MSNLSVLASGWQPY